MGRTPACLLAALAAMAQAPQPAVRVTARLVEVSVVAETKNGEPVAGLTRDDFTLLDRGREERIAFFNAPSSEPRDDASEPLPPNTFTNRAERVPGIAAIATAILFDGLNTRIADQSFARAQIMQFLDRLQPRDRVALYALGRGLNVLEDITGDPGALKRALAKYKGDLSPESESSLGPGIDTGVVSLNTWLGELNLNLIDYYARDRALRTIRALVAIANHLGRLPGRKNLIWVSGSFPVWIGREAIPLPERPASGVQSFWPEIDRAARALNQSNLAIYPVDARGLMAPADYSPERDSIGREMETSIRSGFDTMRVLAERTGGRAFYNNNDLRQALGRATGDGRQSYLLGYQPSHNDWNGKFREIKVKVSRPGVRLRHRTGYFAQPEEPAEAWYRDGVLSAAAWNPIDATRLGITVRVIPRPGALDLELQIDPRDLALQPKEGLWQAALDLYLVEIGKRDSHISTVTRIANLKLDQAAYEKAMREQKLVLLERVDRHMETVLLRVLARDIATGALGSVSVPLNRVVR